MSMFELNFCCIILIINKTQHGHRGTINWAKTHKTNKRLPGSGTLTRELLAAGCRLDSDLRQPAANEINFQPSDQHHMDQVVAAKPTRW